MGTKLTRKQLTTVIEALAELIDNWNDDATDEDRGRDNNALCLLIWDDGSGQLGTQWGDVFNKQIEFDNADELADRLAPWLDFEPEAPRTCDHKFIYGGIKYEVQEWKLAGTGAQSVYYFDWFYCERCLENRYEKLPLELDTYSRIQFNAAPKSESQ